MVRSRSTSVKPLSTEEVRDADVDPSFLVWIVSRSTEDLLSTVLAQVGLTGDEFAIYSILNASPGITPGELSRWMAAPPTSVSSYVKRFEARGHVARQPHPSDRRSYRIQLTTAGKRAHRSAVALFKPIRGQIIQGLGEQDSAVRESLLLLRGVVDTVRGRLEGSAPGQSRL
jgi:DNA-binding MarR family transcriptional regulator